MRILDEKIDNVLDTAHFRYVQLDGAIIKVFNKTADEFTSDPRAYRIVFNSEEEARTKYEEIKKEAGWFVFKWSDKPTLLNTFGFARIFISKSGPSDKVVYSVVFYNSENDSVSIRCVSYESALEILKELAG